MDLKGTMVLVDGQDKTNEIRLIQHDAISNKMLIDYYKGNKVYSYSCSRVQKLENPKVIELNECVAFVDGMPVFEPQAILDFGGSGFGLLDTMVKRKPYFQAHFA